MMTKSTNCRRKVARQLPPGSALTKAQRATNGTVEMDFQDDPYLEAAWYRKAFYLASYLSQG
jgi:hypothetical protein